MKRLMQRIRHIVASPTGAACFLALLLPLRAAAEGYCNNPIPPCATDDPASPCYKPPDPPPKCEPKVCDKCTKSPCYVGSGVYAFDAQDLEIVTTGFPITVTRLYQSSHTIDGESGFGWTSSLSTRLYYAVFLKSAPSTYQREADIRLPNGNLYRFVENASGTYTPPEGRFDTLVRNADSTWDLWLQRTRSHYHFSAAGNLLEMVDDFGNTQTWTYVDDRLQRVEDTSGSGRYIDVTYGADGRISDVTDLTGRNVHYAYAGSGVMTSVTNPAGQVASYSYTNGKYVPLLTAVSDNWGRNLTTVVYDAQDRVRSYTDAGETYTYTYNYNNNPALTAKSDSSGNAWQYTFTSGGLVTNSAPPGGGVAPADTYYSNGLVQMHTDPAGVKTYFTYNAQGNALTVTKDYQGPTAVQWRYTYDTTFHENLAAIIPYDPATNLIHPSWQGETFDYYGPNTTSPGAVYHTYKLDADGTTARLVSTVASDSHGRVLSVTDPAGNMTTYSYDTQGNLASVERPQNNDAGTRLLTTYTTDALGRIASSTDPDGHVQSYTWDVLDRPVTLTFPKPSPSSTLTFTLSYFYDEYDSSTQLLFQRMVDANGHTRRVGYDQFERAVRTIDEAWNIVRNVYANGLLTAEIDANNYSTTYGYDALRRVSTVTFPDGTFERYTYNADGAMVSRRDRANQTITFSYDRHKRLVTKSYPNGGAVTRTFNGQNLTQVVDTFASPSETHTFTWDTSFHLTSAAQAGRGVVDFTYRPDQRRATMSINGGATETYDYYADGSLRTITWSPVSGTFKYDYTLSGLATSITFPNGQTRSYTYDDQGRPTAITNVHPSAGTLAAFAYGYDVDAFTGQASLLGLRTTISATVPQLGLSNALTKVQYDSRYALTRADYPAVTPYNGLTTSWTYDAAGNRTSAMVNGSTASYVYQKYGSNPLNGPLLQSDGSNTFTYDANGSVVSRSGSRGNFTFSVDYESRLRSVAGDLSAGYLYDYEGRRTVRTVAGSATSFLYDGVHAVAESGATTTAFLFGPGIDEPLAISRGGAVYYCDVDIFNSVVLLNDAAGTVQSSSVWDVWGNSLANVESVANTLGYTAREKSEAGLQFYRARYYDPAVGRFTSEDPIADFGFSVRGEIVGPQLFATNYAPEERAQRYAYVRNGPLSFTDPFGLEACCGRPWSDCWGDCIRLYRWTWTPRWIPLFSAVPKPLVPPFRVVYPTQRLTTLTSSAVHMMGGGSSAAGAFARGAARVASRIATPITIAEGFWDWGVIIYCAEKCRRNPCSVGN